MANHAMLNADDHRDLRVQTAHGAEYGDKVMCTLAIPSEFRNLQADYPIFFHRNEETGKYLPMAMFGFEKDENLYLENGVWNAIYIPLMIQRGPFLIGFQGQGPVAGESRKMVVSIDMDNPRVGTEGEPLFQPFGGNSEYLDKVIEALKEIDQGQAAIAAFTSALLQHNLIEPFSLDITLENKNKHQLQGFFTIHEERLANLDAEVLADFSRRGILQAAYMMIASMANIGRLISLKNRRGKAG